MKKLENFDVYYDIIGDSINFFDSLKHDLFTLNIYEGYKLIDNIECVQSDLDVLHLIDTLIFLESWCVNKDDFEGARDLWKSYFDNHDEAPIEPKTYHGYVSDLNNASQFYCRIGNVHFTVL